MANSGKNSNTSQFFVVLTDDTQKLAKLQGKYVVFGAVRMNEDGIRVLERLNSIGSKNGSPKEKAWIGGCGTL